MRKSLQMIHIWGCVMALSTSLISSRSLSADASEGVMPLIVGHRGASEDAPENTLAAFRLAWEQQSDAIEGDFYLTADSQIVCIHDATTKRTTPANLAVQEVPLRSLRQLDAGKWKDPKWEGEKIPTFVEVFQTIPDGGTFVIELKSDTRIVPELQRQIEQIDHSKINLMIISFHEPTIAMCKQRMPEIKAQWLTSFKQNKLTGKWTPTAQQIAETVQRSGADGVGMKGETKVIDKDFIDTLRKGGCSAFHVWTIDSEQDAQYFANLGAMAITTNRPLRIRQAITTNSE